MIMQPFSAFRDDDLVVSEQFGSTANDKLGRQRHCIVMRARTVVKKAIRSGVYSTSTMPAAGFEPATSCV